MRYEDARDAAIMRMWRIGAKLDIIADYVGMTERDTAAIIRQNINKRPSLGFTPPDIMAEAEAQNETVSFELESSLSRRQARQLLSGEVTTPAIRGLLFAVANSRR